MIKLTIGGGDVSYDTLADVRATSEGQGAGIGIWRETLEACVRDDAKWNDFLNELWQSGGAEEAVRLHGLFKEQKARRWFLMALVLMEPEDKKLWQVIVNARDGEPEGLVAWLEDYKNKGIRPTSAAFKEDVALWQSITTAQAGDTKQLLDWVATHKSVRSEIDQKNFDIEIAYWRAKIGQMTERVNSEFVPGHEKTITLLSGEQMTFCWCPATTSEHWKKIFGGKDYFLMGSLASEAGQKKFEEQHRVTLTKGFWIGKYPVTQRQWESVMGWNKSKFKGVNRPVESVSWYDCLDFIAKINAVGQIGVSLPTEAQWEHACRAGTTTPFHFGSSLNGDRANCNGSYPCGTEIKGRSRRETTPVGECQNPNAWGLYDMHGNVWEWCYDRYGTYGKAVTDPTGAVTGGARVCRGGCWKVGAQNCRSSARQKCAADEKRDDVGLRLVWFAGPHGR